MGLNCPSININKNRGKKGKQNYICQTCGRQLIDVYSLKGYPEEVKKHCGHLYLVGNEFRRIQRLN
jgi:transposase-like protein